MIKIDSIKFFTFIFFLSITFNINVKAEEKIDAIADQMQIIIKDLKTLEKAVYRKSDIVSNASANSLNEDILTKHLLKLNEIENQFREKKIQSKLINLK